jgi:hypothetical protein
MRIVLIYLMFFLQMHSRAQIAQKSILKNGDFELFQDCVTGQVKSVYFWRDNFNSSADYFNTRCNNPVHEDVPNNFAGNQFPQSGSGYVGLYLFRRDFKENLKYNFNSREHIQGEFISELKSGRKYKITLYINPLCD